MSVFSKYIKWFYEHRIATHLLFWLLIVLYYPIYAFGIGLSNPIRFIIEYLFYLPIQVLATYFLLYYQMPLLITKKQYQKFVLSIFLSIYVFGTLTHLINDYLIIPILQLNMHQCSPLKILTHPHESLGFLFWIYLVAFIAGAIKMIKQRYERQQALMQLEKEKVKAELNYLKAQIHPKFLANTLENLYSLTLKKSDYAPEVIIKLSDMLDHMLYRCNDEQVLLRKELELIENYLELEALQYGGRFKWNLTKKIENEGATIAPLVLIPLVEFALEFGIDKHKEAHCAQLSINLEEEKLHFQVCVHNPSSQKRSLKKFNKPIEIDKINRQLEILYPDQHQLDVNIHEGIFTIDLQLTVNTINSTPYESVH